MLCVRGACTASAKPPTAPLGDGPHASVSRAHSHEALAQHTGASPTRLPPLCPGHGGSSGNADKHVVLKTSVAPGISSWKRPRFPLPRAREAPLPAAAVSRRQEAAAPGSLRRGDSEPRARVGLSCPAPLPPSSERSSLNPGLPSRPPGRLSQRPGVRGLSLWTHAGLALWAGPRVTPGSRSMPSFLRPEGPPDGIEPSPAVAGANQLRKRPFSLRKQ